MDSETSSRLRKLGGAFRALLSESFPVGQEISGVSFKQLLEQDESNFWSNIQDRVKQRKLLAEI